MLGRKIKHAHRYQEIVNAFLRNGFSYFVYRLGLSNQILSKKQEDTERHMNKQTIGIKLRGVLQGLGPTFIKLGQIASTRRDLIPVEIAEELEQLQDHVIAFSFEQVREIIEEELGEKLETLFHDFNEVPIATASIGQVHSAHLHSGEPIAIKIQRPDIIPIVETDLEILDDLARIMESRFSWAKTHQVRKIINEFAKTLRAELDYYIEGRNCERIARQFLDQPDIQIPKVHWKFTTKRVLTMDLVQGIKVNNLEKLDQEGYDRKLIAERITQSMLQQIFVEGFFHGDPHPGNIYILPENRIAYLDFGMVGRLNDEMKFHFASIIIHLQQGHTDGVIRDISAMGMLPDETDMTVFYNEIDQLVMKYYDISFRKLSLGEAINDLLTIIFRHHIQIPSDLTVLAKTLIEMEGIVGDLDPEFSIMKAAEPFGEKLLFLRYEPKNIAKKSWRQLFESMQILSKFPMDLKDFAKTIQNGNLQVKISVPELQFFLHRLDKISNRLAFSIILLAFSILMVGVIVGSAIAGQANLLWKIPVIEIGSVVATLMFLFIVFSIIRSGRM
ncbi:ABC1 kinase family protein [Schinkia sp. CFF1]